MARSMKATSSQRNVGTVRDRSKGRMVGDWQLQKTLGAGSMGKVKLATNILTGEKVSQGIHPEDRDIARFERPD